MNCVCHNRLAHALHPQQHTGAYSRALHRDEALATVAVVRRGRLGVLAREHARLRLLAQAERRAVVEIDLGGPLVGLVVAAAFHAVVRLASDPACAEERIRPCHATQELR